MRRRQVVPRLADDLGLHAVKVVNVDLPRHQHSMAHWMILSRNSQIVESFRAAAGQIRSDLKLRPIALRVSDAEALDLSSAPLWTDDYSDLLSVLRLPRFTR